MRGLANDNVPGGAGFLEVWREREIDLEIVSQDAGTLHLLNLKKVRPGEVAHLALSEGNILWQGGKSTGPLTKLLQDELRKGAMGALVATQLAKCGVVWDFGAATLAIPSDSRGTNNEAALRAMLRAMAARILADVDVGAPERVAEARGLMVGASVRWDEADPEAFREIFSGLGPWCCFGEIRKDMPGAMGYQRTNVLPPIEDGCIYSTRSGNIEVLGPSPTMRSYLRPRLYCVSGIAPAFGLAAAPSYLRVGRLPEVRIESDGLEYYPPLKAILAPGARFTCRGSDHANQPIERPWAGLSHAPSFWRAYGPNSGRKTEQQSALEQLPVTMFLPWSLDELAGKVEDPALLAMVAWASLHDPEFVIRLDDYMRKDPEPVWDRPEMIADLYTILSGRFVSQRMRAASRQAVADIGAAAEQLIARIEEIVASALPADLKADELAPIQNLATAIGAAAGALDPDQLLAHRQPRSIREVLFAMLREGAVDEH